MRRISTRGCRSARRGARIGGLAGLLLAALAGTARAQERPAADSLARQDSARTLAPVTVTVLRTPFELARAPYAVSVLGAAELQRARPGFNLAEALVAVPGVQVDNRFNYALGERISVRGFGARAQFGVRGVRVLIDGIPATMPDGQTTLNHVDVADLGRAEIVRGPASAIYGNASGGVLQLETQAPPSVPVEERARVLAGSDGLNRLQSTTAGQLGAGSAPVGYDVNVSRLRYGGYRAWSDARNTYANVTLRRDGRRTRVRVAGHLADYEARNPGGLTAALLGADRRQAFEANAVRWRAGEEGRHRQLGAEARQQVGAGELRLTGYAIGRAIDNPIPQTVVALDRRAGGARLAYATPFRVGSRAAQIVAGLEANRQRDSRQNFANDTGRRGAPSLDQRERVTATAGFAQLALDATRRVSVVGALRYDRTAFAVDDRFVTARNPDDSGERALGATSPSVGVSWRVGEGASLYANFATAFETPTTTELANRPGGAGGFNPELEPQRTRSAEVGGTVRVGRVGLAQLSMYRAAVRGALVPFEVLGAAGRQFFRNAGAAVHRGVEAGATVAFGATLAARAAYTYTDARFGDYLVDTVAYDGRRVPGVAPHRADVVVSLTPVAGLVAEVEERYTSAVPVNDANAPGTASGGYALTNVRLTATRTFVGRLDVAPYGGVSNLFDRAYNASVVVNAFGGRYYEPGPGRTVYVGLELRAR